MFQSIKFECIGPDVLTIGVEPHVYLHVGTNTIRALYRLMCQARVGVDYGRFDLTDREAGVRVYRATNENEVSIGEFSLSCLTDKQWKRLRTIFKEHLLSPEGNWELPADQHAYDMFDEDPEVSEKAFRKHMEDLMKDW